MPLYFFMVLAKIRLTGVVIASLGNSPVVHSKNFYLKINQLVFTELFKFEISGIATGRSNPVSVLPPLPFVIFPSVAKIFSRVRTRILRRD